jgi:hypothetical protein
MDPTLLVGDRAVARGPSPCRPPRRRVPQRSPGPRRSPQARMARRPRAPSVVRARPSRAQGWALAPRRRALSVRCSHMHRASRLAHSRHLRRAKSRCRLSSPQRWADVHCIMLLLRARAGDRIPPTRLRVSYTCCVMDHLYWLYVIADETKCTCASYVTGR